MFMRPGEQYYGIKRSSVPDENKLNKYPKSLSVDFHNALNLIIDLSVPVFRQREEGIKLESARCFSWDYTQREIDAIDAGLAKDDPTLLRKFVDVVVDYIEISKDELQNFHELAGQYYDQEIRKILRDHSPVTQCRFDQVSNISTQIERSIACHASILKKLQSFVTEMEFLLKRYEPSFENRMR